MPFARDYWEINIKGVSVWQYFRFEHNELPTSKYSPKIRFGIADIVYFFKWLLLRLNKTETVIFLAARNDLISLMTLPPLSTNKAILFLREDGHNVSGNVFFIESCRYLFRKYSSVFFKKSFKELERQLLSYDLDTVKHHTNIKAAVGDYYFNKVLSFLLKNKKVYFSNCVIPKIERTEARYNSVEIQHGVIHKLHPDYANIPIGVCKVPLLCWGNYWHKKIQKVGFLGEIIIGSSPVKLSGIKEYQNSICFFTTLNVDISKKIEVCLAKLKEFSVVVQPHPRDLYKYNISAYKNVRTSKGLAPSEVKYPIMHDSTLIYSCLNNNKKFIYFASNDELKAEIIDRLTDKYDAKYKENYYIAYSSYDVIECLNLFEF